MKKRNALLLLSCLAGLFGRADIVHVFEQTKADGQAVQISDRSLITGMPRLAASRMNGVRGLNTGDAIT